MVQIIDNVTWTNKMITTLLQTVNYSLVLHKLIIVEHPFCFSQHGPTKQPVA